LFKKFVGDNHLKGLINLEYTEPVTGITLLMIAIEHKSLEIAELLIKKGAELDTKDINGTTALMLASHFELYDIVNLLIDKGVKMNTRDNNGTTALMMAVAENKSPKIAKLLIDKGADVNLNDKEGYTALMIAIKYNGLFGIVELLIDKGADVNATNNEGGTALMFAGANKLYDITELLINKGADVNATNNEGNTALMVAAAENNSPKIAKLLIGRGTKLDIQNKKDETALDIADNYKHGNISAVIGDKQFNPDTGTLYDELEENWYDRINEFGKKRRSMRKKQVVGKRLKSKAKKYGIRLKSKAKKYGIRLTVTRNGKRRLKSRKVLEKQVRKRSMSKTFDASLINLKIITLIKQSNKIMENAKIILRSKGVCVNNMTESKIFEEAFKIVFGYNTILNNYVADIKNKNYTLNQQLTNGVMRYNRIINHTLAENKKMSDKVIKLQEEKIEILLNTPLPEPKDRKLKRNDCIDNRIGNRSDLDGEPNNKKRKIVLKVK
jgi:ankyrin repeat protein